MTLLLPYFFQETGAEDQAGKFKKNALPQNTATDGIYQKSTTFQHLKKAISSTFHRLIHHVV